ncbi:7701_t:CDS:2, partial [Funneliformis mosseae]
LKKALNNPLALLNSINQMIIYKFSVQDSSWGYRGDDGKVYYANIGKSYGPGFKTGDTIGCCLNFRNNKVFYTINGVNLGIAFRYLKSSLYPCVKIESQDGEIKVNFGHKKFKYTGEYKKVFADCIKLLEFESNNAFALKYQGEIYNLMGRRKESLADLIKLLEINANDTWMLK